MYLGTSRKGQAQHEPLHNVDEVRSHGVFVFLSASIKTCLRFCSLDTYSLATQRVNWCPYHIQTENKALPFWVHRDARLSCFIPDRGSAALRRTQFIPPPPCYMTCTGVAAGVSVGSAVGCCRTNWQAMWNDVIMGSLLLFCVMTSIFLFLYFLSSLLLPLVPSQFLWLHFAPSFKRSVSLPASFFVIVVRYDKWRRSFVRSVGTRARMFIEKKKITVTLCTAVSTSAWTFCFFFCRLVEAAKERRQVRIRVLGTFIQMHDALIVVVLLT